MSDAGPSRASVETLLADFPDPETGKSVLETGQVEDLSVVADKVHVTRSEEHTSELQSH